MQRGGPRSVIVLFLGGVGLSLTTGVRPQEPAANPWVEIGRLEIPNSHAWSAVFSSDGKRLVTGSAGLQLTSGELNIWNVETQQSEITLPAQRPVRCVAFSPDGTMLATAEHDAMARLRDPLTGNVLHLVRGHRSQSDTLAFSADSKLLATSGWDGAVKIWDTATGNGIRSLEGHSGQVFTVAFGSGDTLASAGSDTTIKLWRASTGDPLFTLLGHQDTIHWLAFAASGGKLLASASWDKTVRLWDAAAGKPVAILQGHKEAVQAVAFTPDGKTLVSAASRRPEKGAATPAEVVFWDVAGRSAKFRLQRPAPVFGLAFAPDGKTLAMASWDGTVTLFKENAAAKPSDDPRLGRDFKFGAAQIEDESAVPKKDYAAKYQAQFDEKQAAADLVPFGPDVTECVQIGAEGIHINLPLGFPRHRSGTGVITDFGLQGDFEITMNYQFLTEPKLFAEGNPTEVKLVVVPQETVRPGVWHKTTQDRAMLARESPMRTSAGQFVADMTSWHSDDIPKDQWGNETFNNIETHARKNLPTAAKQGRLRLVRSGSQLYFLVSDGVDKDFTLLSKNEFGAKDVKDVRVLGVTGGPNAELTVRVTDLRIQADAFTKGGETILEGAVEPPGHGWRMYLIAGVPPVVLLLALVAWRTSRRRPSKPSAADSAEAAGSLVFPCSSCGKRLKVKAERAGARLKCPQCGKTVEAPKVHPGGSEAS